MSSVRRRDRLRALVNLANLSTPLGLTVAALGGARLHRGPRGLLLCDGYRPGFPAAGAFTVGNVVITSARWSALRNERPLMLDHEERHATQWAACLGLPFLPAYIVAMGWSVLRTGDRSARNVFERGAGLAAGGYRDLPARPLLPVVGTAVDAMLGRARTKVSRARRRASPRAGRP